MTIRFIVLICMAVIFNGTTTLEYSNSIDEYVTLTYVISSL